MLKQAVLLAPTEEEARRLRDIEPYREAITTMNVLYRIEVEAFVSFYMSACARLAMTRGISKKVFVESCERTYEGMLIACAMEISKGSMTDESRREFMGMSVFDDSGSDEIRFSEFSTAVKEAAGYVIEKCVKEKVEDDRKKKARL